MDRLRLFEENNINGGPFHASVIPTITSSATFSAVENQTAVGTVTATGTGPQTTYITGGADAASFAIDSTTGVITFVSAPDYEIPTDVGGNNVYDLTVTVAGPGGIATQNIAVTVTDSTADNPPVITSSATFNAAENQTAVGTVTATGQATITYAFTGGADDALFAIDSNSGVITFLSAPDYETPLDAGADNVYNISVSATNGLGSVGQNIAITVTDVNEYVATASDYDGTNDYAKRGADLTGIADGKAGTLSLWLKFTSGSDATTPKIFSFNNNGATSEHFVLQRLAGPGGQMDLVGYNAAGTIILRLTTSTAHLAAAGWFHFLASWDLAATTSALYINDVVASYLIHTNTNDTLDYTNGNTIVGARVDGALKTTACYSEILFHTTYIDLSVTANRRKFISAAKKPVDLGVDGSTPLGVQPLLYAPNGNASTNAGSGGNFTVTGTLTACSTSPSD